MKIKNIKVIDMNDWNDLVQKTYGRIYSFQQQDFCKDRGLSYITIPSEAYDDFENDTIPEVVNGDEMGVSFKAWLKRDPNQKLNSEDEWDRDHGLSLFWMRNFYPDVQMVANDLHAKGLIESGEYCINIDW